MAIYLLGDTHGAGQLYGQGFYGDSKKIETLIKQYNPKKGDKIVFLGDFGYLFYKLLTKDFLDKADNKQIKAKDRILINQHKNLEFLASLEAEILVIPGNHENYDEIYSNKLKRIKKYGGHMRELERKNGSIYFLERGEIFNIDGKKILTIGGALSIDKAFRTEGKDWWALEYLTEKEKQLAIDNIRKYNGKIDYILSHTCPKSIIPNILGYTNDKINDDVAIFLDYIYKNEIKEFKHWYFGHFHTDVDYCKFSCLYDKIKIIK